MREPTENERKNIALLLDMSIQDLYQEIGLAQAASEGSFLAPGEAINEGEKLFNSLKNALYEKVCVEWQFCKRQKEPAFADVTTLICSVSDVILGLVGSKIPAINIAVILFKIGLTRFCGCQ